jgi:glycosyltransferase involved in cell wall biosynthesis
MKILHVIPGIDPRSGGPQYALRRLVEGQIGQGHSVSVLTTSFQSGRPKAEDEDFLARVRSESAFAGANLVITPSWRGRRGVFRSLRFTPRGASCFRNLVKNPATCPDVIHFHEIFSHLLATSGANARRYGIPYVITPHGSLDEVCYRTGHTMLKRIFAAIWLRDSLRYSSFLHVTSEFEAAQVSHLSKWISEASIRIIPLGADLPQYDSDFARNEFRKAFPQLNGRRFIFHLARIHQIKRLEILVRALARLPEDCQDVLLAVAGQDSGHLSAVRKVIDECALADRVLFLGFVSGAAKQGAFEAAAAFALPSRHENHGVSVLEALIHGVPVVVTPQVASQKYVQETGCGSIVEGTPEAFATALTDILRHPQGGASRHAIDTITKLLSWDRVLKDIDELYREMLAMRDSDRARCEARPCNPVE